MKRTKYLSLVIAAAILLSTPSTLSKGTSVQQTKISYKDGLSVCTNTFDSIPNKNLFNPREEGSHYPCLTEWWYMYSMLELENGKNIDISSTFQYWMKNVKGKFLPDKSYLHFVVFDRDNGKVQNLSSYGDDFNVFTHKKNTLDLKYYNCTMRGLYPNYKLHLEDKNKNIMVNINFRATSKPYWLLEGVTNGYMPFGLNCFRYGVILTSQIHGNISYVNISKTFNFTGKGYFEHAWGDLTYDNLFTNRSINSMLKITSLYTSILRWFMKEKISCIRYHAMNISFSTSNMFGYDWCYGTFDNGWAVDFWKEDLTGITEGPVTGFLVLTKNGKEFLEFNRIKFQYKELNYLPEEDTYIPSAIKIDAFKENQRLSITFKMTTNKADEIYHFNDTKNLFRGFYASFAAGTVTGYFYDGENNITLNGKSAYAAVKYFPKIKYNSINFSLYTPPKKGFTINIISHSLGVKIKIIFQLHPQLIFKIYVKRLEDYHLFSLFPLTTIRFF